MSLYLCCFLATYRLHFKYPLSGYIVNFKYRSLRNNRSNKLLLS